MEILAGGPQGRLTTTHRAVQRFLRGVRLLQSHGFDVTGAASPLFIGFHGTGPDALADIRTRGFDTERRRLQNQGPGEYLAVRPRDALAFTRDGARSLLVVAAVRGPQLLVCDEFCAAGLNPPSCSGHAFCLPLLEVPFDDAARSALAATPATGLRYQYLWADDGGQHVPYTDVQNAALCAMSTRWQRGDGVEPVRFEVHRHRDHATDRYSVDLQRSVQTNLRTGYERAVKWRRAPGYPGYV